MGGDETTVHIPELIKGVFSALGQLGRESGAQATFSFQPQAATLGEIGVPSLSLMLETGMQQELSEFMQQQPKSTVGSSRLEEFQISRASTRDWLRS